MSVIIHCRCSVVVVVDKLRRCVAMVNWPWWKWKSAEFGICRKLKRYTAKILAHPVDKRTSPINRTRNVTGKVCHTLPVLVGSIYSAESISLVEYYKGWLKPTWCTATWCPYHAWHDLTSPCLTRYAFLDFSDIVTNCNWKYIAQYHHSAAR